MMQNFTDNQLKMTPQEQIRQEIIKARKKSGLTQLQLANKLDCSEMYIYYLEKGTRVPSFQFLIKLAQETGKIINIRIQ